MNATPELIGEVKRWVEKAEHDLTAAEHSMSLADKGLTDIICFHCQQCAEKYLKGLLVLHKIPFPKTHDLRLLLELAQKHSSLKIAPEAVLPLNRYTIEGRYPGDWEPIDKQEAEEAIKFARGVRDAVRELMPKEAVNE